MSELLRCAMKIGLIDVDSHNYPNLALMKISSWHKKNGDHVEWWNGFEWYDRVYMSRVFDLTYTPDPLEPVNCQELFKGGTGWPQSEDLPYEIEHCYPDYTLYGITDVAYGFLTRGCPRGCDFCIVSKKEGRGSVKVSDLSEWWNGQRNIVLMDPNILACREHIELLEQLADSKSKVDFNQGLDCRLLTEKNIAAINNIRLKEIHFSWDKMGDEKSVLRGLELYSHFARRKPHGAYATVYVLTNYGTDINEDLYRIYTLRQMGYDPYVMIFDKPHAPKEILDLQRWCNNRVIYKTTPCFKDYKKQTDKPNGQESICQWT